MSSETWTSCNMPQKRLEAFLFWGFHTWGPWYLVCVERNCDRLKGRGAGHRSHREEPWLNTGPAPRKEREGLACTDQEELISCDIIELYINNLPEKWVAKHWLTEEAECVKARAPNYLLWKMVTREQTSNLNIWTATARHKHHTHTNRQTPISQRHKWTPINL